MQIVEIALKGSAQQLPSIKCGEHGCIVLRPFGAGAMLLGSSSIEVNLPLPADRPLRVYPCNSNELWVRGTDGETLHLLVDREVG